MAGRALTALGLALAAACPGAASAVPALARAPIGELPWLSTSAVPLVWIQADVAAAAGPLLVQVDVTSREAQGNPAWVTRLTMPAPFASGLFAVVLPVDGLEGTHDVRVVLPGAVGSPLSLGAIRLDRAAPAAREATIEPSPGRSGEVTLAWAQSDDLSGTAGVVVEVNTSVGVEGETWLPFEVQPQEPWDGPHVATTTTADLDEGTHLVRVRAVDAAGNVSATTVGSMIVDRRAPAVEVLSAVRTTTEAGAGVALTYRAGDPEPGWGIAPGALVTVTGPGGAPTYAQAVGGPGEHVVHVPSSPLPSSQLVVRVADRGGLVGESAPASAAPGHGPAVGPASVAQDPLERLRGARVILRVPGGRRSPGHPATVVTRVSAGGAVTVAGRLVDRDGAALGATDVEMRDAGGRRLGTALTDAGGRFRRSVRPAASGPMTFGVPAEQALPLRSDTTLVVRVRPRLTVLAAATSVRLGDPVTLRGRFHPAPAALIETGRKTVDLEYRDPAGNWRSGVTTFLARDGSFSASWTPPAPAPLPIRARVRKEVAWPFGDVWSRTVVVQVG
ncbi:MAG: hypothetical protein QOK40_2284 [Miltoncostaeaceae bacterium]|nr:hypothetical protein [Miltoncostaeaceae bacterium]